MKPRQPKGGRWRIKQVQQAREELRAKVAKETSHFSTERRLAHLSAGLSGVPADDQPEHLLSRFLWIMSILVHHQRFGGLKPRQVGELGDQAHDILRLADVKPKVSRLAFLLGELTVVLAQIARQFGNHWDAAWQQGLAVHFAGRQPTGGPSFMALQCGDRALRLGDVGQALAYYELVGTDAEAPAARREKAQLARIKSLRLSGQTAAAAQALAMMIGAAASSPEVREELAWEELCLEAMGTATARPLVNACRRGRPHFAATYLVEAWLWARAFGDGTESALPTMHYIGRPKSQLTPRMLGPAYKIACALEGAADEARPLTRRLTDLGRVLGMAPTVAMIDREMLIYAAAARWLSRSGLSEPASLAESRYRALSLALSDGRATDVLQVSGP